MIVLNLIQNVALLVALAAVYQVIGSRFDKHAFGYKIASGLLFGGVGLVGMMTPLNFMPGVIFDGRSIILSVSGLFGGPIVAAIAASMCGAYRLWLGGAGALVGVGVIAEAAALGVLFHFLWRGEPRNIGNASLYLFGLLVHLIMLALMFALPAGAGYEVLRRIGLPIIVIYPVAVMLVCRLFLDYEGRIRDKRSLDESQQRLLEAQRIAKMGDFKWDVETGEVTWSDALFELLGYDKTETIDYGKVNANIHHPDDMDRITRWLEECIESGKDELTSNEYRLVRKNGETLFVRTVGIIRHRPGRKPFIFATIQDITESRKAEEALRESEAKYRTLFEQMGNAVAVYQAETDGADFIFIDFNKAAERIEQISRKEIIGQSVLKVFPAVREFGLFDVFRRVWRTGKPERHPVTLYKDERIEGWRDNFVYKLPTGEIVAVYTDETERKRSEQALQKSESFQKALITASPVALYSIDFEGNVLSWNQSAERIFGWKSDEVIGRPFTYRVRREGGRIQKTPTASHGG